MDIKHKRLGSPKTGEFFKGDVALGDGPKEQALMLARMALNPGMLEGIRRERQRRAEGPDGTALPESAPTVETDS